MTSVTPLVVGTGPVRVIALHGWYGFSGGWGEFPTYIDTDEFSYVFADYRGYGRRKTESGDYSLAEISTDVRALADDLGWDRFALLGHSMGGIAAAAVLADMPERVTHLVGISPVPPSGVPFDDETFDFFAHAAGSTEVRHAIVAGSTGNRLGSPFVRRIVAESIAHSTVEAFDAQLTTWVRSDVSAHLAGIDLPVKLIVGEYDADLGAEAMQAGWLPHFPNAEVEVMANAGHYAMYETPPALAASVAEFLLRGAEAPHSEKDADV
ncbi:MAG TPA: alpha/beta hydrolase [Pseudolysinimonas sp.]|nr:alpha/beta hydrolase [Pseudolysinimonas sp.]